LTSTSGDLRVEDLQGGAKVKSASGEITLSYLEFNADLEVRSSSGDVKLLLTEAAQFRLEARASSGDIRCEFPVTLAGANSEMSRHTVIGTVGDGGHHDPTLGGSPAEGSFPVSIENPCATIDPSRSEG
jgi:lia operon protein LiaG